MSLTSLHMQIIHARAYTHEAQTGAVLALTDPCHLHHNTLTPADNFTSTATDCVAGVADLLVPLAAKMSEEPFRLVIMDSVAANLRVDFTGRGTSLPALHAVRQKSWMLHALPTCHQQAGPLRASCSQKYRAGAWEDH